MTLPYRHIGFIGLGLMGGSIALLIRNYYPNIRLFGFSRQDDTIQYALSNSMIDSGATLTSEIPKDLDLVFICTPISKINEYIALLSQHIEQKLVITDVGSIKRGIGEGISLRSSHVFIGGHPMAGSEKSRVQHANIAMMKQATYLLMNPSSHTPEYAVFNRFIQSLDFRVLELEPSQHDYLLTLASHFPFLMATLTATTAQNGLSKDDMALDLFRQIISSGFRDTTRVAASSVEWAVDICQQNKENLLTTIQLLKRNLTEIESLLQEQNENALTDYFKRTKSFRDSLY